MVHQLKIFVLLLTVAGALSELPNPQSVLDQHNKFRSEITNAVGAIPDMIWDASLEASAQAWASECKQVTHSDKKSRKGIGENLAYGSLNYTPEQLVKLWTDEKSSFDDKTGECIGSEVCGHYEQIVWETVTALGCGWEQCSGGGLEWNQLVCHYNGRVRRYESPYPLNA